VRLHRPSCDLKLDRNFDVVDLAFSPDVLVFRSLKQTDDVEVAFVRVVILLVTAAVQVQAPAQAQTQVQVDMLSSGSLMHVCMSSSPQEFFNAHKITTRPRSSSSRCQQHAIFDHVHNHDQSLRTFCSWNWFFLQSRIYIHALLLLVVDFCLC
jgi:hypothetical protein